MILNLKNRSLLLLMDSIENLNRTAGISVPEEKIVIIYVRLLCIGHCGQRLCGQKYSNVSGF